jgi:hypothetical protein
MNYSITRLAGPLSESKAFGTRTRKVIDLRSLEARAYAIVHKHEYPKIVARQTGIASKKLVGVKRKLRTALMREVHAWKTGGIEFSTLIKRSRSFIDTAYREAYLQGLKAQGHGSMRGARGTKLSPTDQLTREDLAWIKSASDEEMRYWTRFMKAMRGDEEEYLSDQQTRRLDMYISTVDSLFDAGRVQGAGDWMIIDWVLGDAEHCPECLYLAKHSPYTKETLPCTPRSGCTRCLSNCKCKLVLTGVDRARYTQLGKRIKSARHLEKLERSRRLQRGLPEVAAELVRREARARAKKQGHRLARRKDR